MYTINLAECTSAVLGTGVSMGMRLMLGELPAQEEVCSQRVCVPDRKSFYPTEAWILVTQLPARLGLLSRRKPSPYIKSREK